MEGSKAGTNNRSPDGLSHPNHNNINKHNTVLFYKKCEKHNEIQLTKIKIDLNIRKMTNHPPSPLINELISLINSHISAH